MGFKNMKRLIFLVTLLAGFNLTAVCDSSMAYAEPQNKVIAYYFHGNMRCPTCHKMEEYAKETIDVNFASELSSGKLAFKVVNVEKKENEHFVNEYQLYTKSLIVSLVKGGKEVKSKNLTKIWEYVRNKNTYSDYVNNEIATFLKEL